MNSSQVTQAILKLNRETAEGKILWDVNKRTPSSLNAGEELQGNTFLAAVMEKSFRLYKLQQRAYHGYDEGWDVVDSYRLEMVDSSRNTEWIFPDDSAIADLYQTVLFQTSGAQSFFDSFLSE